MELVAGKYKQTDIGLIPCDWEVKSLGGFTKIYVGRDLKEKNYSTFQDFKYNYPVYSNTVENEGLYGYYDIAEYEGDSLTIVGRGVGLGTAFRRTGGYGAIGRLLVVFPDRDIDSKFLTEYINHRVTIFSESNAIPQLTGVSLASYKIALPTTKAEQTAIATALSDIDDYISHLEKLIHKKRLVKQGAMQQLLKPKEGWVVKKLGEIGRTYGGLSGKTKDDFQNGIYPYIPFMNIMSNPVIDTTYFDFVKIGNAENQNKASKGDLFFNGSSETPEEVGMCSVLQDEIPNLYLNSFCFGFRLLNIAETNGLYLSFFFRSGEGRKLIFSLAQGATRYNLSKSNFLKLALPLPLIEEQTQIAAILSDMDAEIASLEKQLVKAEGIKQGMMQQLLTGKIRLV